jgi:hypothetical protein
MKKLLILFFLLTILSQFIFAECLDLENGANPFIKGTIILNSTGYSEEYYDRCGTWNNDEGLYLIESFCSENEIAAKPIDCLKGCKDGVCLEENFTLCEEKENYIIDYFHNSKILNNTCLDSKKLVKYKCGNLTENKYTYATGRIASTEIKVFTEEEIECDKCIDGRCSSYSLLEKIENLFKSIFKQNL